MASTRLRLTKLGLLAFAGCLMLSGFLVFRDALPASAANSCNFNRSGNFTLTASECSVTSGTIDGIDAGNLTIGTNKLIRIETGAQLVINPGSEISLDTGAQLIIDKPATSTGAVVKGLLCVTDSDQDGYIDYNKTADKGSGRQPIYTFTNSASCSIPYVRKSASASLTQFDCFDTVKYKADGVTYKYRHESGLPATPIDLTWSGPAVVQNVGTCGQYVAGKQRRLMRWTVDSSPAYCGVDGITTWDDYDDSLTCCLTGYRDYDKDGYGTGSQGCYDPSSSYNVVANDDDCNDSDGNIKVGSTRTNTSCYTDAACGTAGQDTCQAGGHGVWASTTACTQVTAACCSAGALRPNTYVCQTGTFNNPASGSCVRTATDYRCTGTTTACGTTNPATRYEYASTNGQTWNQSTQAWAAASCSVYASLGSANACSGQQPTRPAYGCTAGSNTTYTGSAAATCTNGLSVCSGTENSLCSGGTCQNFCSSGGADNDGDGFNDNQDNNCTYGGCSQCLSGACCNAANACYASGTTCRAAAGTCDLAETCSGSSASCPVDSYRSNSYLCYNGSPSGNSGDCRTSDTDQYCSGVGASCNGSTNVTYGYASANGQVWNGSGSWVYASYSGAHANITGPDCNGQTPRYSVYGCVAGSNTIYSTPYTYQSLASCSGAENNRCVGGSCIEQCSDKVDNDGNGLIDDADPACPGNQCTSGACCDTSTGKFRTSSYTCRASAGTCDVAEVCSGSSASCPADSFRASSYKCYDGSPTGSANSCATTDTDQYCSGTGATCNGSTYVNYGYASLDGQVWTGSSWVMSTYSGYHTDVLGPYCSGNTPYYQYYGCMMGEDDPSYVVGNYNLSSCAGGENSRCVSGSASCQDKCRDMVDNDGDGFTDEQDTDCGGCGQCSSGACCDVQSGCFFNRGDMCRTPSSSCDKAEFCTGSSGSCPSDAYQPSSYVCRTAAGTCDQTEYCTGASIYCPADSKKSSGTVCRAANGTCDPAETCNGSSNDCPGQTNTDGVLCASSSGPCENDRYCSSGTCPASNYKPSGTVCSNCSTYSGSANSCQTTSSGQYCSGSSASCNGSAFTCYGYAPINGQVWNGSSWVYASYSGNKTAVTGPYCSGQTPYYQVYGCTAGSATNYYYTNYNLSACQGKESNMCSSGSCQNLCANSVDNDGDGFNDTQDSDCGGYSQCTSGTCCNTTNGSYLPNTTICGYTDWGSWAGSNGVCQINRSRGIYKCPGTSSSCSASTSGTDYEYSNISNSYVWYNGASRTVSSSYYCGVGSPIVCSSQQPQGKALGCNGSNSCSYTSNYYVSSGTACNGTTNTCISGSCVACTSGYKDYDKDGYGYGTYSCWTASSSYNVVANSTDCYDSNANARPGQTSYFATNRGDGSFDYNCSGLAEVDPTTDGYGVHPDEVDGYFDNTLPGVKDCEFVSQVTIFQTAEVATADHCGVLGVYYPLHYWEDEGCGPGAYTLMARYNSDRVRCH